MCGPCTLLGLRDPPDPTPPIPSFRARVHSLAPSAARPRQVLRTWGMGVGGRRKWGFLRWRTWFFTTLKIPETPGPVPPGLLSPFHPRAPEVNTLGTDECEGLRRDRERDAALWQDPSAERVEPDRAGPTSQVCKPTAEARTARCLEPKLRPAGLSLSIGSQKRGGKGWSEQLRNRWMCSVDANFFSPSASSSLPHPTPASVHQIPVF